MATTVQNRVGPGSYNLCFPYGFCRKTGGFSGLAPLVLTWVLNFFDLGVLLGNSCLNHILYLFLWLWRFCRETGVCNIISHVFFFSDFVFSRLPKKCC